MTHQRSFGIRTPREFLEQIIIPQYEIFLKHNSSSCHALLSIMTAYHMHDWAFGKAFREGSFKKQYPGAAVVAGNLAIAREIANGTKHFQKRPNINGKIKTRTQKGFSSGFSYGFARPLMIEKDDGSKISVDELLESIIGFWKAQQAKGVF